MLCFCACPQAFAQTHSPGSNVLFGAVDPQLNTRPDWFDATVSVSGAYDDDLTGDQGVTAASGATRQGGQYSIFDATLSFAQKRKRFSVVARGASSIQRYPGVGQFVGSNGSGSAIVTANLGRKTLLRGSLDAAHISSFSFDTLTHPFAQDLAAESVAAEGLPTSGFQTTAVDWTMDSYGGTGELVREVSKRTSVGLIGGLRHSQRQVINQQDDAKIAGAQVWRTMSRTSSMRLAYIFLEGTQGVPGDARQIWSHDLQVGIDKQWAHSARRRTALSLSGGPSVQRQEVGALSAATNLEPSHLFRVAGGVALTHMMTDTWTARLSYRRGTGVANSLVFSNIAAVDLRGSLSRRLDLQGSLGYTDGDLGVGMLNNRYGTSYGSARLQLALSRSVALYGQAFLYRYDFTAAQALVAGSPRLLNRRGARIGINVWLPFERG